MYDINIKKYSPPPRVLQKRWLNNLLGDKKNNYSVIKDKFTIFI